MDTTKAKNIVIAMLVFLNLFLLVNNMGFLNERALKEETVKNTVTILKERGVILECSIPGELKNVYWLGYSNKGMERKDITKKLMGNVDSGGGNGGKELIFLSDTKFIYTNSEGEKGSGGVRNRKDSEFIKAATKFLKDNELLNDKYIVEGVERNTEGDVIVTFMDKYDKFLLFDNYYIVTFNERGIVSLECNKLQTAGFVSGKTGVPSAAYQALLLRFKEGENQVITGIDVGYKFPEDLSMKGMESVELLPVWRVKLKGIAEPEYLGAAGLH